MPPGVHHSILTIMRNWVFSFGVGICLFLSALVGGWVTNGYFEARQDAIQDARSTARAYTAYTTRLLQTTNEVARVVESWLDQGLSGDSVENVMRDLKTHSPFLMDLLVLDGDGRIAQWTANGEKPDVRDRPYFRMHRDFAETDWFVDAPRPSRVHLGKWYFSVSRAVRDKDDQLQKVVVAIIDAEYLQDTMQSWANRPGLTLRLVHDSGMVVAAAPPADRQLATGGDGAYRITAGPRDEGDSLGWGERVTSYPFVVEVTQSRDNALRIWRQQVLGAVVGLLVACIAILAMSLQMGSRARRLAEAEALYRGVAEQSLVGILIVRPNGEVVYANAYLASLLGRAPPSLPGLSLVDLVSEGDRRAVTDYLALWALLGDGGQSLVVTVPGGDGLPRSLEIHGRQIDLHGQASILCVVNNVTERKRVEKQLEFLAYHDSLTGLPNRSMFFDQLNRALARYRRSEHPFALLMVDLDGFKAVNDQHGHEMGDVLLQTVADRMLGCLREADIVARVGGDEFVVLLDGVAGEQDVRVVAEKLLHEVAQPVTREAVSCAVGASIGVALCPRDGSDSECLLAKADIAMYRSKSEGKHRLTFASGDVDVRGVSTPELCHWGPHLELGLPVLDQQHNQLNQLLNAIGQALATPGDEVRVREHLGALVDCVQHHFATEEALMARHDLPCRDVHRIEHQQLIDELRLVRDHFHEDRQSILRLLLRNWLVEHIQGADRRLVEALRDRGVA